MKTLSASILGALALSLLSAAAPAQTATPTDSKLIGDWLVRCAPANSLAPCDMREIMTDQKSQQRILTVSIAYVPSNDKHVLEIIVPLNVDFRRGLTIMSDTYNSPVLHYRHCDRNGCYVETLMQNDIVTALAANTNPAKIRIYAYGGHGFDIPLSLKGFSDAHGAMQDLARKRAGGKAPAPAAPAAPAPASAGDNAPAQSDTPAPTSP